MCIDNATVATTVATARRERDAHLRAHSGQHHNCGDCAMYRNRVVALCEEHGYSLPEAGRLACTLVGLEIVAGW